MTIDSVPELARRVRHLETLVKRGKPADGSDNASLLKRISALESSVARIGKAAPTKPQVYTPKPANNSLAIKVSDHGALTGLADNDHPQYLLTTGKASDSDKLDGLDSTDFATAGHDHDSDYLGISAKAADSDKLDGLDSTDFGRPVFLTAPLTSTSWDGDSFSTTAKTKIDLSAVFDVPAGIKAVLVWVAVRDSASQTTDCYFRLSPVSTGDAGMGVNCDYVNDRYGRHLLIVPCDANGDIYYQIAASGTGTMDVFLQIWGYWL